MPLREHLLELRRRVVLATVGLLAGAVVGWLLYDPVLEALQEPILSLDREGPTSLNFPGVATSFDVKIKVSLFLGVLLSSPWWLLQLWLFVTPGLTTKERRSAVAFIAAAAPLFLAGAYLAWRVLPNAVRLLTEFTPDQAANFIDAQLYLSFVMRIILAFGIAFLLPVLMVGLTFTGLVRGSTWLQGWRWAVVLVLTFSAFATPTPDVVTMFAVGLPMLALYFAAVGVCVLRDRRDDARRARELAGVDGAVTTHDDR